MVIAVGHVFSDVNKRTAFTTMDVCLRINGIAIEFDQQSIGDIIIKVAQGVIGEVELARHLREIS